MPDPPSTALPESSSYLSPEGWDAASSSRDTQTRRLSDPSMLGCRLPGKEASQLSKDRETVQREVYGDYMDLDEHALDSTYGSLANTELQPYVFSEADLTPTRQTHANQSAECHPKRTIPWGKSLALLSIIPGSGASNVTRSSDSVSLGPPTSYSGASSSAIANVARSSGSISLGPPTSYSGISNSAVANVTSYDPVAYEPPTSYLSTSRFDSCTSPASETSTGWPMGRTVYDIGLSPHKVSQETSAQCEARLHCAERGCRATFLGTYAKGSLARHRRLKHGSYQHNEGREYVCEEPGCSKSYKRQDARLKHYRKAHRHLDPGVALSRTRYRSV